MSERTISYSAWTSPGSALFTSVLQYYGDAEGVQVLGLPSIRVTYSVKQVETRQLASGFNAVPVPSNAVGVAIVMPEGNTVTVTLKGVTGDTGIALNPNGVSVLTLSITTPPATIGVTTGSAIAGVRFLWF